MEVSGLSGESDSGYAASSILVSSRGKIGSPLQPRPQGLPGS